MFGGIDGVAVGGKVDAGEVDGGSGSNVDVCIEMDRTLILEIDVAKMQSDVDICREDGIKGIL